MVVEFFEVVIGGFRSFLLLVTTPSKNFAKNWLLLSRDEI